VKTVDVTYFIVVRLCSPGKHNGNPCVRIVCVLVGIRTGIKSETNYSLTVHVYCKGEPMFH